LIYSPLRRDDGWNYSLPEIMKAIKGAAWRINHMLDRKGPVWQEEFFDHVLRGSFKSISPAGAAFAGEDGCRNMDQR